MVPELVLALSAICLAAIAAFVAFRQWRRAADTEAALARLGDAEETNREILETTPDGLLSWDCQTGSEHCSRRLAVLLDLPAGTAATYDDVLSRLDDQSATALDDAVAALRRDGTPFDLLIPVAMGQRMVHAVGLRAGTDDDRPLADLLWMRDVSDMPGLRRRSEKTDGEPNPEEDWLQALLQAVPFPLWLRGPDLEVAFTNEACAETDFAEHSMALAASAKATQQAAREEQIVSIDGGSKLYEIMETPVAGWPGILGFAIDRSQAEELQGELARVAAAQSQVMEGLNTAIGIFGPERRLTYFNSAFADLWPLDRDWLATEPDLGEVLERLREMRRMPEYPDFRVFKEEMIRLFVELREPKEDLIHLPDGTALRRLISPHPLGGLVFAYDDVSGQLDLERSLNTVVAVQQETLDNLYEGVAVFGSDGRLKLSNPTFAGMWHLSSDDLAKQPHVTDFVEGTRSQIADTGDWSKYKKRVISRLMSRDPDSGRLRRTDGRVLDYANVPLPDGAMLLSYLDVSDSARVEHALRERAEALREADRLKTEFISNVSYEIRTPLNTVIGFAEMLSEEYFGKLNRRQMEYSQGILETSKALMTVISDILDFATIEAGMMALELDTVDLHDMLVSVVGLIRERARRKNINLDFNCSPKIGWIVADENRLKQVVFNLLSNAVETTATHGTIELSAKRDGDEMAIIVADTGSGRLVTEQGDIFHGFKHASAAEAKQPAGSLGLSLVKRFIELHGGHIEVNTRPKKGTTVTCYLPAGHQTSKAVTAAKSEPND